MASPLLHEMNGSVLASSANRPWDVVGEVHAMAD